MKILRTKSVEQSIQDADNGEQKLKRTLGPFDLIIFGIGIIVGTGIFVLTGIAAATQAGPAIILSFLVSGVTCALAALCYTEFASTLPVAGSAYTFAYASLGELVAWIIGWDLLLEVIVGASVVFYAYLGFDIVSTTAEETRNPQRDMPIGILGSLAICTLLYIAVSFVLTGMVS